MWICLASYFLLKITLAPIIIPLYIALSFSFSLRVTSVTVFQMKPEVKCLYVYVNRFVYTKSCTMFAENHSVPLENDV